MSGIWGHVLGGVSIFRLGLGFGLGKGLGFN
jgi:hypothetical protein